MPPRTRIPWTLWPGLAFLALFVALAVCQRILVARMKFVSSEDLLTELASAELLQTPPAPGDWTQWRGPRRDGITSMPELPVKWPSPGPPRKWRKASGEGYSSVVVSEGRAYTMIEDEGEEAVVCWNLADGKERWRHRYAQGKSYQYPGPRATPTVVGDRLWTVTPAGTLLCLQAASGDVVWEVDLVGELQAKPPQWGFTFSPLVEEGRVFALTGARGQSLAAFDAGTGKLLWGTLDDPAGYSSPVSATIAGQKQIVFFTARRVLGLTPDRGQVLWQFDWLTEFEVNAATPLVIPARDQLEEWAYLFVSSGYGRGCGMVKVAREGAGFRARRVYESNELCCHFASPVRRGDHVYGLDETRDLTCLDLRTGQVKWRFGRDEEVDDQDLRQRGFKKGSLIRVDDRLLVLGEDGKLALVEASPERYQEITAFRPARERCWAMPTLAEGRMLIRDRRQVLCFDLRPAPVPR